LAGKWNSKLTRNTDELDEFYAVLKAGTTAAIFLQKHNEVLKFVNTRGLTEDYRLGKGRVKKLRDEVSPVSRFIRTIAKPDDLIRFALDNRTPDCVVSDEGGHECDHQGE